MDSVAKGLASSLYFKRPLKPSTGWSHPASAHSASQASDTHITSMGALAASLVTIVSRYCAHGALMYSTVMPVSFSKAVMWALTWSTAADQAAKVIFSPARAGGAKRPCRAAASPAPAEAVKRARRVTVGRPMLIGCSPSRTRPVESLRADHTSAASRAQPRRSRAWPEVRSDFRHEEIELPGIRREEIEGQLLDARVDSRLESRDELLGMPHQVEGRGVLVAVEAEPAEDRAQAVRRGIAVDVEVVLVGEADGGRIAPRRAGLGRQHAPGARELGRVEPRAGPICGHEAVALPGGSLDRPQRRVSPAGRDVPAGSRGNGAAGQPDRRVRSLDRPGNQPDLGDREDLASIRERLSRPESFDDREHLVHPPAPRLLRHLAGAKLPLLPADSDAEDEPALRGHVEVGEGLGGDDGIA